MLVSSSDMFKMCLCLSAFCAPVSGNLCVGDVKDDIDISNVCASIKYDRGYDYSDMSEHIENLIANPYTSPDYIFHQIEQISLYVRKYSGRHFQIKSVIQHVDTIYKSYTGKNIEHKWMNAIVNYASKRDVLVNHHNYCYLDEEEDEGFRFEKVVNFGFCAGMAIGDFADRGDLMQRIRENRGVAPWTIEDVPPKITIGVALTSVGYLLGAIAGKEVAVIAGTLQVLGIGLIVEHTVSTCQQNYDVKQHKRRKEKGFVDIREPYEPEGVIDIRQIHPVR